MVRWMETRVYRTDENFDTYSTGNRIVLGLVTYVIKDEREKMNFRKEVVRR